MNRQRAYQMTPGTTGYNNLYYRNGNNTQLVKAILNEYPAAKAAVKNVAPSFRGTTDQDTLRKLYNWIGTNIKYRADESVQLIKHPARLLRDGIGDCKSLSLFSAAVLNSLGIPAKLRFVSYDSTDKRPSHVYVVTPYGPFDPTLSILKGPSSFGHEEPYQYKKDYTMEIRSINGPGVGKVSLKKVWTGTKTVALSGPRQAFLALVQLNARAYATRLALLVRNKPEALKAKWNSLGGNYTTLKKAISRGKNKKPILWKGVNGPEGIGEPTTAALIASATAVIAALTGLLKEANVMMEKPGAGNQTTDDTIPDGGTENNNNGGGFLAGIDPMTLLLFGGAAIWGITQMKPKRGRR